MYFWIGWIMRDRHRLEEPINEYWRNHRCKGIERPKTEAGNREVLLLSPALEALERQKEFTGLKKAEVCYQNTYKTRHTYDSMMLSQGKISCGFKDERLTKPALGYSAFSKIHQVVFHSLKLATNSAAINPWITPASNSIWTCCLASSTVSNPSER